MQLYRREKTIYLLCTVAIKSHHRGWRRHSTGCLPKYFGAAPSLCLIGQETEIWTVWQMKQIQQQSNMEEELPHLLVGEKCSGCPAGEELQGFPELRHLFGRNQFSPWHQSSSPKGRSALQKEEPVLLVIKAFQLLLEELQSAQSRVQPFYSISPVTKYLQGFPRAPAIFSWTYPVKSKQDSSFPKATVSHKTTGNNLTLAFCLFYEQSLPTGDLSPQDEQTPQSTGSSLTYVLLNEPFVIALLYVIAEVSLTN